MFFAEKIVHLSKKQNTHEIFKSKRWPTFSSSIEIFIPNTSIQFLTACIYLYKKGPQQPQKFILIGIQSQERKRGRELDIEIENERKKAETERKRQRQREKTETKRKS
jgi:hypothetical protein